MTSSATVPDSGLTLLLGESPPAVEQHVLRRAWAFPQAPDGRFAGDIPAGPAVGQLEYLRTKGATYLVVPTSATEWMAGRPHLSNHLNARYRVATQDESCRVYDLRHSSIGAFLDSILPAEEPVIAVLHFHTELDLAGRRVYPIHAADPELVEALKSEGLRFLVLPDLSPWAPLDPAIRDALERRHRKLAVRPGMCTVLDLAEEKGRQSPLARLFRDG